MSFRVSDPVTIDEFFASRTDYLITTMVCNFKYSHFFLSISKGHISDFYFPKYRFGDEVKEAKIRRRYKEVRKFEKDRRRKVF